MSKIMKRVETIRENEIVRAYKELEKLGINNQQVKEILDLMTRSIIKKSFQPLFDNVRSLVFDGENSINYINFLIDIFKDGNIPIFETKKIKKKQISKRSSS
jgi:Glutamyl-tRNA reductase